MKKTHTLLLLLLITLLAQGQNKEYPANYASAPRFKALVYYSTHAEEAHVDFAKQGVEFFKRLNYGEGFYLDVTTDFSGYTYDKLKEYDILVMLNDAPSGKEQREAFQQYMENGF